jgi:hypothetical protein
MAEIFASMFQDEALVVKSLIESAGIEAEIAGEHIVDVYPAFFPESGGMVVSVPDEDTEDARSIVEDYLARKAAGAAAEGSSAKG